MNVSIKINLLILVGLFVGQIASGVPLGKSHTNDADMYEETSLSNKIDDLGLTDEEANTLRSICLNLASSKEWSNLEAIVRDACVYMLFNGRTDVSSDNNNNGNNDPVKHMLSASHHANENSYYNHQNTKDKRFFALEVGKSKPLNTNHKSNVGFKYGRK